MGWAGVYAADRTSRRPPVWRGNRSISQTTARHPAGTQGTLSPSNPHPAGGVHLIGGSEGAVPASCPPVLDGHASPGWAGAPLYRSMVTPIKTGELITEGDA